MCTGTSSTTAPSSQASHWAGLAPMAWNTEVSPRNVSLKTGRGLGPENAAHPPPHGPILTCFSPPSFSSSSSSASRWKHFDTVHIKETTF